MKEQIHPEAKSKNTSSILLKTTTLEGTDFILSLCGRLFLILFILFPYLYVKMGAPLQGKHLPAFVLAILLTAGFIFSLRWITKLNAKSIQLIKPNLTHSLKFLYFLLLFFAPISEISYLRKTINPGDKVYAFAQQHNDDEEFDVLDNDDSFSRFSYSVFNSIFWFMNGYKMQLQSCNDSENEINE